MASFLASHFVGKRRFTKSTLKQAKAEYRLLRSRPHGEAWRDLVRLGEKASFAHRHTSRSHSFGTVRRVLNRRSKKKTISSLPIDSAFRRFAQLELDRSLEQEAKAVKHKISVLAAAVWQTRSCSQADPAHFATYLVRTDVAGPSAESVRVVDFIPLV